MQTSNDEYQKEKNLRKISNENQSNANEGIIF